VNYARKVSKVPRMTLNAKLSTVQLSMILKIIVTFLIVLNVKKIMRLLK